MNLVDILRSQYRYPCIESLLSFVFRRSVPTTSVVENYLPISVPLILFNRCWGQGGAICCSRGLDKADWCPVSKGRESYRKPGTVNTISISQNSEGSLCVEYHNYPVEDA
jgi:hypothetical protein